MKKLREYEQYKNYIEGLALALGIQSQTELAKQADIPRNILCAILNGRVNPTRSEAYRIGEALGLGTEEFETLFPAHSKKHYYTAPTVFACHASIRWPIYFSDDMYRETASMVIENYDFRSDPH